MTALLGAVAGAVVAVGIALVLRALFDRSDPGTTSSGLPRPAAPKGTSASARLAHRLAPGPLSSGQKALVVTGVAVGPVAWLITGWPVLLVAVPLAVVFVPRLIRPVSAAAEIERLDALDQWVRTLVAVLDVGMSIEDAIKRSLSPSTPVQVRPAVAALVARLNAGQRTEAALNAFSVDIGDVTGDRIAAALIISSRNRGQGLSAVLKDLAQTVSDDVRIQRSIEADRARPRAVARWVTMITMGMLVLGSFNRGYVAPYGTFFGQLVLAVLLTAYGAALVWMRAMTRTPPLPRFLQPKGAPAR